MSTQKARFRGGEADAWYRRNGPYLADPAEAIAADPVVQLFRNGDGPQATRILEIGAGVGWRLAWLNQTLGASAAGIEPSADAVREGRRAYPELDLHVGTAEKLPFEAGSFDLVIYGFCLYLCDPEDLFVIASEADRVLMDKGHILIYDFYADEPYRRAYSHAEGVFSYKMDFSALFRWHPAYKVVSHRITPHHGGSPDNPDDRTAVTVLKKDLAAAFGADAMAR